MDDGQWTVKTTDGRERTAEWALDGELLTIEGESWAMQGTLQVAFMRFGNQVGIEGRAKIAPEAGRDKNPTLTKGLASTQHHAPHPATHFPAFKGRPAATGE